MNKILKKIEYIQDNVLCCDDETLDIIAALIRMKADQPEKYTFMLHKHVDDFIYVVNYAEGHHRTFTIGERAYLEYLRAGAVSLGRIEKDLTLRLPEEIIMYNPEA